MDSSGEFVFGPMWAVFRCVAGDNTLHPHPTVQIVLAHGEHAEIELPGAEPLKGHALLVCPSATQLLKPIKPIKQVTLVFVEPQTALASRFADRRRCVARAIPCGTRKGLQLI